MHPQTKWRNLTGWSQGKLAPASDVDQCAVSKIENNAEYEPRINSVARLCIASAIMSMDRYFQDVEERAESRNPNLPEPKLVAPLRPMHYADGELAQTYYLVMEMYDALAKGTPTGKATARKYVNAFRKAQAERLADIAERARSSRVRRLEAAEAAKAKKARRLAARRKRAKLQQHAGDI